MAVSRKSQRGVRVVGSVRAVISAAFVVGVVGLLLVPAALGSSHEPSYDASDFFIFSRAQLGHFAEPDCDGSNNKQVDVSGSNSEFYGRIHGNADLAVSGNVNKLTSAVTFGTHDEDCKVQAEPQVAPGGYFGGPPRDVDSLPFGVATDGWPGDLSSYLDATPLEGTPPHRVTFSSVEQALPGETCDVGDLGGSGVITLSPANNGQVVCNGEGKVQLNVSGVSAAEPLVMSVTILSHGPIEISGQNVSLTPAVHNVLAMTDQPSSVNDVSIKLAGSNLDVPERAILFTPRSGQDVSGSGGSEMCVQLIGQGRIKTSGSNSRFGPSLCEPPSAPEGTFTVDNTFLGASVTVETNGGIWPFEISVLPAREYMEGALSGSFAGPAVDIRVPEAAPPFRRATLTLPYREQRLGGAAEESLRIYGFDEGSQFWVKVPGTQSVDTGANTVTASVTHFSVYAVLKGRTAAEWAEIFGNTPVRCVGGETEAAAIDVVFLVDSSGSMGWNDPTGQRVDGAKLFVDEMRRATDRASVVGFESFARRLLGLTALDSDAGINAVKAALEQTRAPGGGTDIGAAVQEAIAILSANGGGGRLRVAVLLTDGVSPYNTALTTQAAEQGIEIHTVGLGSEVNAALLQGIADGTGASYRFLANPDGLPELYRKLARDIIGEDTDSDGDTLSDCVERNGMFVPISVVFPIGPTPPDFPSFITTKENLEDSDGDTLPDGGPGGELERKSLLDDPSLAEQYSFLIDAGLTEYYVMHSNPNLADSDGDGLRDDLERANGTNPLVSDRNELGIEGLDLPPFTLFQPWYDEPEIDPIPLIGGRWALQPLRFVAYNEPTVSWQRDTYECRLNCDAVRTAAEARDGGSWCWFPLSDCSSVEERMQDVVAEAVEKQGIFDANGDYSRDFMLEQASVECVLGHSVPQDCAGLDAPEDSAPNLEALDEGIGDTLMSIPGGYRPKNLCGGPNSRGGTYRLVDRTTNQPIYVGRTNDFVTRERQWLNSSDPALRQARFETRYHTDDPWVQKGLEQRDYNDLWGDVPYEDAQALGSRNGQRPLASDRTDYVELLDLAQEYLDNC